MKRWWAAMALASVAAVARASDKPLYQPAPAWVAPAPAIDATKLTEDSPVLLTLDQQGRFQDGLVWNYRDVATRLASPEVVTQAGTLTVTWQPAKGDLIVHRVEIIRAAEHIDLLAGGKRFEVLRREQQLEQLEVTGRLTATMMVEGLRVGDVLRLVTSETNREPAFHGGMEGGAILPQAPNKVGYVRARLLWPSAAPLRWRRYAEGPAPTVTSAGGVTEVTQIGELPKPAELPADAPLRFRKPPMIEASSFDDWAGVSRVMAPLYATDGAIKPGGALDDEVKRIAAAESDPAHRAAAALQLVQSKVRYLANGMENGNYVPQSPEQTWSLRYGDCKAKTLLLLAILRRLGIEAEPALANIGLGDLLPERLPGAGAFNHVLAHVTIGSESLWLDGTASGARYAALRDAPPLRWVLPVRAAGATLMPVPARAPAEPMLAVRLELDQSAGLTLPTLVHAVVTLRGPQAESIGIAKVQGSKEQKDQAVGGLIASLVGREFAVSDYSLNYDPAAAVATIDANGLVSSLWRRKDGRYRLVLDPTVGRLTFEPDRARAAWRSIPVATGTPGALEFNTRVRLPAGMSTFALEGDSTLSDTLGGLQVRRTSAVKDGIITVEEHDAATGAEIAPADVPAARARVALAKTRLLTAVAPADVPARWINAEQGKRDGRFKPILAAYARAIADDPQQASGYINRANFLMGVFDWRGALPDLDKALALEPTVDRYLQRAQLHRFLGEQAAAMEDARAALRLDPAAGGAIELLSQDDVDHGRATAGLARVQERIDAGGDGRDRMLALKAELQSRAGNGTGAVATLDQAIAAKPGSPMLLNARCWAKAKHSIALDTALKDCTKAIELSESSAAALDSRALAYFRLGRLDDSLADLNAALEIAPNQIASLYLRGVILSRQGHTAEANGDLNAARIMEPLIAADYQRFGVAP